MYIRDNQEVPENRLSTTESQLSDEKRVCKGNVVKHNHQPTAFHLRMQIGKIFDFLGALPVLRQFSGNQEFPESRLSTTETLPSDEKRVCRGNVVKPHPQRTVFHLRMNIGILFDFLGALPVLRQFSGKSRSS